MSGFKRKLVDCDDTINLVDDDSGGDDSCNSDIEVVEPPKKVLHRNKAEFKCLNSNRKSNTQDLTKIISNPFHSAILSIGSSSYSSQSTAIEILDDEIEIIDTDSKDDNAVGEINVESISLISDTVITSQSSNEAFVENLKQNVVVNNDVSSSVNIDSEIRSVNVQDVESNLQENEENNIEQKLLDLSKQIDSLKAENETLKSAACVCCKNHDTEALLTVVFRNLETYKRYRVDLIRLFESSLDIFTEEDENNLVITVSKDENVNANEWVIIDSDTVKIELDLSKIELDKNKEESDTAHKKRKKKKKNKKVQDNLFILDTTPSELKTSLKYDSKFSMLEPEEIQQKKGNRMNVECFNCGDSHNLRDCPKPKDFGKISAAKLKFKSQQQAKQMRYYTEYGHLQPGNVSEKLKLALGMQEYQLPSYIYRMRLLGYPPGWFNELVENPEPELVVFDFDGKDSNKAKRKIQELDSNKIISYPGFNASYEKGIIDEYELHQSPRFSDDCNKEKLLEYARTVHSQVVDNLESWDMELDTISDKEEILANKSTNPNTENIKDSHKISSSPTLTELESEKEKLLAALTDDTIPNSQAKDLKESNDTNTGSKPDDDPADKVTVKYEAIIPQETSLNETNPDLQTTTDTSINNIEIAKDEVHTPSTSDRNESTASPLKYRVKTTNFGTPILKSASPYNHLPNPINFSKNVCEVINFENLPNSTGKYKQMVGILEKVRNTLRNLHQKKT